MKRNSGHQEKGPNQLLPFMARQTSGHGREGPRRNKEANTHNTQKACEVETWKKPRSLPGEQSRNYTARSCQQLIIFGGKSRLPPGGYPTQEAVLTKPQAESHQLCLWKGPSQKKGGAVWPSRCVLVFKFHWLAQASVTFLLEQGSPTWPSPVTSRCRSNIAWCWDEGWQR